MDVSEKEVKDTKRYLRALLILLVVQLLAVKLPYSDKSLIVMLIPPITKGSSTLSLAGLPILFGYLWCFDEIRKSRQFNFGGFTLFVLYLIIVIPLFVWITESVRLPVYWIRGDVYSVEIVDSDLSTDYQDNTELILLNIEMESHGRESIDFEVNLLLGDEIMENIKSITRRSDNEVQMGNREKLNYEIIYEVVYKNKDMGSEYSHLFWADDYKISLISDDKERIEERNDIY